MFNLIIDSKKNTIEMSKKFAKAASRFGSEEYRQLQEARRDYPTFRIVTKTTRTKKSDCFKGLTYSYMESYIKTHDDEDGSIMAEFEDLRATSKEAEELNMESASYQDIKAWFLETYPEIAKFQEKREKIMKRAAA